MVEARGLLSLAVGMALSGPTQGATAASAYRSAWALDGGKRRQRPRQTLWRTQCSPRPNSSIAVSDQVSRVSDLAKWLRQLAGRAETSMRRLASALGRSPSGVHEELRRLVASGLISVARAARAVRAGRRVLSIIEPLRLTSAYAAVALPAPPSRRASQNARRVDLAEDVDRAEAPEPATGKFELVSNGGFDGGSPT